MGAAGESRGCMQYTFQQTPRLPGSWFRESTQRPFTGEYRLQWPPFERVTGFQNSESWLSLNLTCWGWKRFTALPLTTPPPGPMPSDCTLGGAAFEVIGTDFADPILYKPTSRRQGKAYLVIFSCSLSQAVHLELVPSLKTSAFLPCLKRLIARRGRPRVIYSDNGSTFVKAAKWLKQVREDEKLQGYLESHNIEWKFNLSHAPWWGGQFERLIGVVKKAMHKVIGRGFLFWNELIDVLLEVET